MEKTQTRALRILYNFDSNYKALLDKSGKCTMEVKRLRALGLQIFKTLNELNSVFTEGIFHRTEWFTFRKHTHTHTHTHTHKNASKLS